MEQIKIKYAAELSAALQITNHYTLFFTEVTDQNKVRLRT
jgi:hypothetical protein